MKQKLKLTADILMTLSLFFLMGYQLWGELAHEIVGTLMFILFIAHHILNINWHKNLFKGKYSARRTAVLIVDVLVLITMLMQMFSGIIMSRYVFDFVNINGAMAVSRKLHILGSYWGFLLMSIHLGMHWNMIITIISKKIKIKNHPEIFKRISFILSLAIAIYGAFALVQRDFFTYMFLKSEFVFMNYDELKILFYIDYIAIMGLFVFIAHYTAKLIKIKNNRRNQ